MFNINFITVGKLKEAYLKQAIDEYSKRLSAFCKFKVIELNESRLNDDPSDLTILKALENEGKMMLPYIKIKDSFNIAMCIEGVQISSEQLAQQMITIANNSKSTVNFIIGSSFGLDNNIKNICDLKMSMSKMTFPHQLARVMLAEQVYRAFSINKNLKYHK